MVSEWKEVPIGELCLGIYDGPHATPVKTKDGPLFLGISNLASGRLNLSETEHLSEDDFPRWTKRVTPQADDIVFSYETRLGQAAILPKGLRCCLGRRMALMRINREKADPHFLLYSYLGTQFQEVIRARTIHGSTVDRIPLTDFPGFPILVPPLPVQKEIGKILWALDDKIELNRKMNATLETMAHALFKSWFVDFDPVKAKAEGRAPEGMDADTAALFPSEFEESELGAIPKGWQIKKIGEVAARIAMGPFGSRITTDNFVSAGVPVIRGNNLTDGFNESSFVYLTEEKASELRSAISFPGDIVFTHRGTLGQVGLIPERAKHKYYIVSQSQMLLSVDRSVLSPKVIYRFFRSSQGQQALLANTSQTGVPAIARPTTSLKAIKFVCPPKRISDRFEEWSGMWDLKREINIRENESLAAIRDSLLPRLISGQLRIPDIEQAEKSL